MIKKFFRSIILFSVLIILVILLVILKDKPVSAQTSITGYFPFISYNRSPYYANGLEGGTIEGIVIDPKNSNVLYAGSWGNGIYKSEDGGKSWVRKNTGLQSPYVYEIAIDPRDSQHILVSAYEHGINESKDGGDHWTEANIGIPTGSVVYSIDFHPINSNIVYIGLREPTIYVEGVPDYPGGVYKSDDGGRTWVKKSRRLPNDYVYDLAIDPNNPDIIYAAMHDTGVWKTNDGAEKWLEKRYNLISWDIRSVVVTPDSSRVYIGYWDGYGFAYSENGGREWVNVASSQSNHLYVYEVNVDPFKPSTVFLSTYSGLYRCDNPSKVSPCSRIAHGNILVFDIALDVSSGPDPYSGLTKNIYAGLQYFALHKSTNAGRSFEPIYSGIDVNVVNSLIINPINPAIQYMSIYGRGIFKSEDNGTTWIPLRDRLVSRLTNEIVFRPGSYNVLYAAADFGSIYWSTDAGRSWLPANTSQAFMNGGQASKNDADTSDSLEPSLAYSWMDPIDQQELFRIDQSNGQEASTTPSNFTTLAFKPDLSGLSQMIAGTSKNGIKMSNDFGHTWVGAYKISKPIYDSITDISQFPYLYFVGMKDNGVMCAGEDRRIWEVRNSGMHNSADVFSLELVEGGVYLAGTDDGLYKTKDGGMHWYLIGLSGIQVNDVLVDSMVPGTIWAATNNGLYQLTGGATSWAKIPIVDLFNENFIMLAQIPHSNDLYIGTDGGGMIRWTP